MPIRPPMRRLRRVSLWLPALCVLALPGCGADGFARDSVIESSGAEGFLDRIQSNCAKLSVGNQQLDYLLSSSNDDVGFVDAASKYYLGQFTAKQFRDYIEAFYPTGTNGPALDCIDAQLGTGAKPAG
jgi:hypothetical protein